MDPVLKALGVCRVSTAEQALDAHFSLGHQRRVVQEYCGQRSWDLVDTVEYVQSGGSNQRELDIIVNRIRREHITVLVVAELDRLARDMVSTLLFLEELGRVGCRFVAVADALDLTTPDGELRMMVLAMFAHHFRAQLSRKVRGGQEERFRAGKRHGPRPFGYVPDGDTWGMHPEEAVVVQQIFAWYLSDIGQRGIAMRLNEMGVPNQRGAVGHWDPRTIGHMLRREVYCGDTIYQKFRITKDRRGHQHQQVLTPAILRDTHPAIIDRALWQRTQERLRTKEHLGPHGQRTHRVCSGLVRCGVCGGSMSINRAHYVCRAYISKGQCGRGTAIRQEVLEQRVSEALGHVRAGDITPETCAVWLAADPEWQAFAVDHQQRGYERQRLIQRLDRATEALLDGALTPAEFRDMASRLRHQVAACEDPEIAPIPEKFQNAARQVMDQLMIALSQAQITGNALPARHLLQRYCRRMTVDTDQRVTIEWGSTTTTPSLLPFAPVGETLPPWPESTRSRATHPAG